MKAKILFLMMLMMANVAVFAQDDDDDDDSSDQKEQQGSKYGVTPDDSVACVMNYSLYSEYFQQKEYNDAVKGWRKVIEHCPSLSKNSYINGVKMYKQFIKDETDEAKKEALIDTLLLIYDWRIENFGQEGYVLERKGGDLLRYRKDSSQQAYTILKRSLELQGKKMSANGAYNYYKSIYYMAKDKLATKEDLINEFATVIEVVDYQIANSKTDKKKQQAESAKANIEKIFTGVAKCEDLIAFYTPKFEATPDDTTMLKNIVKFLDKQDCTEEKLYQDAASKLCDIKPSYDCAMALGKLLIKKDDYAGSLTYFKNAVENATTDEQKVEANFKAAQVSYNLKSFANVRSYCNAVLAANPNYGEAYLLIGDAYAASANQCGENECTKKSAYWAAVDKYYQAKNVDESVAEKANKKIAAATGQFPKKTDCFFHSINEGDSYTVGCWINETTKVRVRE